MILLGPAGSPEKSTLEGVSKVKELGLDAMEVEFVRGVRMSNELAKKIGELAKRLKVKLSVHAPYYINLCSEEKEKRKASKKRILKSAERAHYLGATHVVFHAGYYGKYDTKKVYDIIKKSIIDMNKIINKNKWKTRLAPETTGKRSQFGGLDELMRLRKQTKCSICVDFAHLLARNGSIDYKKVFDKLKGIKHIHSHFSGINYGEKGEINHEIMKEKDIEALLKEILKRKINITIISESPITWQDSLKMKRILERLKKG
jgi:deoxyribonuclease-4